MTHPLEGRVALVTGVGRRIAIGAAIARRLAGDGAAVVVHSWVPHDAEQPWGADPGGPEAVVAEVRAAGGRAEHVSADLADPDAPARSSQRPAGRSGTSTSSSRTTPAAAPRTWSS